MINLQDITLQIGPKVLLDNASVTIHAKQKAGILGRNGCGKTTLFKVLRGELQVDAGEVKVPSHMHWAHIRQDMPETSDSALAYTLQGDKELSEIHQQLQQAEAANDGVAISHCHEQLAAVDGYAAESRAAKILLGLGFTQQDLTKPVCDFSGGWRMRLNLAQVLISPAEVLLLDEPTNHLDLEAIFWLEKFLQQSSQTILLISHDRDFLDRVTTHIIHFQHQQLSLFTGNYSSFEKQYAEKLALQQANIAKQQREREHLQKFVDRFRAKATKAKQAQSRMKMLERLPELAAMRAESKIQFSFRDYLAAGNPLLRTEQVAVGYDEQPILSKINLTINEGDRIGLIGRNGAGKSTLVKLLSQSLAPMGGMLHSHKKIRIGYFAQHQLEQLSADQSSIAHLQALDRGIQEKDARQYLGGFDFRGDKVFEPIANFSGGEKARLVLALLIWQQPNFLLLDEPTNHLDMGMRDALNEALQAYQGALIVISHDRFMLQSLVDDYYLVRDGTVSKYAGDLDDYRDELLNAVDATVVDASSDTKIATASNNKQQRQDLREARKTLAKAEKSLEKLLAEQSRITQQLADADLYNSENQQKLLELQKQQKKFQTDIAETEANIFNLMEKIGD